ncbi:MAG TPA: DNA-binding protein [Thermoplasmata archaeon]|nr:DNA-binding protein [Thermoplasmata archaeon]
MSGYPDDAELAELRRRRLQQLQEMQAGGGSPNAAYAQAQQAEMDRREAERAEALRRIMTPEARERLGRIRLAKPDVANAVEQQVLSLAASGRLQRMVDDNTLRALLERIMPEKREIHITRR